MAHRRCKYADFDSRQRAGNTSETIRPRFCPSLMGLLTNPRIEELTVILLGSRRDAQNPFSVVPDNSISADFQTSDYRQLMVRVSHCILLTILCSIRDRSFPWVRHRVCSVCLPVKPTTNWLNTYTPTVGCIQF